MIKKAVLIILSIVLLVSGCSRNFDEGDNSNIINSKAPIQGKNNEAETETPDQDIDTPPKLGGISLGDSADSVVEALGSEYTESDESDNARIIGEDTTVWSYESGIIVYIGKTSGKVLRVTSTSPDYQTDLGIKVGDNAKTVQEAYEPISEKVKSRHDDEVLDGWFLLDDGVIMIFDFDKSDGAAVNSGITPNSKVEEIILAYWEHYD